MSELEEIQKEVKDILKRIDIEKIEFNKKKTNLDVEVFKREYFNDNFVKYEDIEIKRDLYYQVKYLTNKSPILFKRVSLINLGFLEYINTLNIKINNLIIKIYYYFKDNNVKINYIAKELNKINGVYAVAGWHSFFSEIMKISYNQKLRYSINKKKIFFLMNFDKIIKRIENDKKNS